MHTLQAAVFFGCFGVVQAWVTDVYDNNYNKIMTAIHGASGSPNTCSYASTFTAESLTLDDTPLTRCTSMFEGCSFEYVNLKKFAEELDTKNVISFEAAFKLITNAGELDLKNWDVSAGKFFSDMFNERGTFFSDASSFNSDLSKWDVSSGINFNSMFEGATSFESDLSSWDVSSNDNFIEMFYGATAFNSDLSKWDVSSGTKFHYMFEEATSFNSDLSKWDVNNGLQFYGMFRGASSFNSDLSKWDVSSGEDFESMFRDATSFESDLSSWDVSLSFYFYEMFEGATSFNSDLSKWDVSSGEEFYEMFEGATSFNSDLSKWDVSSGEEFYNMFKDASSFNSDLSTWDVSSGTDFTDMFYGATLFNSDLSAWGPKLNFNPDTHNMFNSVPNQETCWYNFTGHTSKDSLNADCGCKVNEYVNGKVCTPCATGYANHQNDDPFGADTVCDQASSLPAPDYNVCKEINVKQQMHFECADKDSVPLNVSILRDINETSCNSFDDADLRLDGTQPAINNAYAPVKVTWGDACFGFVECTKDESGSLTPVTSTLTCTATAKISAPTLQTSISVGDTNLTVSSTKNIFKNDTLKITIMDNTEVKTIIGVDHITNTIIVDSAFEFPYHVGCCTHATLLITSSSSPPEDFKNCNGQYCGAKCSTEQCAHRCTGNGCATECDGYSCGRQCVGYKCAAKCKNEDCGLDCVGDECAAGCTGQGCGEFSMYFETPSNKTNEKKMGLSCDQYTDENQCIRSNDKVLYALNAVQIPDGLTMCTFRPSSNDCVPVIEPKKKLGAGSIVAIVCGLGVIGLLAWACAKHFKIIAPFSKINSNTGFDTLIKL